MITPSDVPGGEKGGVEGKRIEIERHRIPTALWQDVRFSLRSLRQNLAPATTCLIVLALVIGANTAIFSAVRALLLDPLPHRDPGRLMALYEAGVAKGDVHDEAAPGNLKISFVS